MKKIFIVLTFVLFAGVSCIKVCGCSPVPLVLYLVIRNQDGDLLNASTKGYFAKDKIQLYNELQGGMKHNFAITIKPPIATGNFAVNYYQILIYDVVLFSSSKLYLKLGDRPAVQLQAISGKKGRELAELIIDGASILPEKKNSLKTLFFYNL